MLRRADLAAEHAQSARRALHCPRGQLDAQQHRIHPPAAAVWRVPHLQRSSRAVPAQQPAQRGVPAPQPSPIRCPSRFDCQCLSCKTTMPLQP